MVQSFLITSCSTLQDSSGTMVSWCDEKGRLILFGPSCHPVIWIAAAQLTHIWSLSCGYFRSMTRAQNGGLAISVCDGPRSRTGEQISRASIAQILFMSSTYHLPLAICRCSSASSRIRSGAQPLRLAIGSRRPCGPQIWEVLNIAGRVASNTPRYP